MGVNEYEEPTVTLLAGVPLIDGAWFGASCTLIAKAGSEARPPLPSLTEITMLANAPTLLVPGVPLRRPLDPLKLAHVGLFVIEYVNTSPSGSDADGVNE